MTMDGREEKENASGSSALLYRHPISPIWTEEKN
jgi:hypothetical protein